MSTGLFHGWRPTGKEAVVDKDDQFFEDNRMESSRFSQLEHRVETLEARVIGIERRLISSTKKQPEDANPRD